jgi:hypothetical protein
MLYIQVKSDRDPHVLAELIASTQDPQATSQHVAPESQFVRDFIAQETQARPAHDELETVNFQRLDDENDWTDV